MMDLSHLRVKSGVEIPLKRGLFHHGNHSIAQDEQKALHDRQHEG